MESSEPLLNVGSTHIPDVPTAVNEGRLLFPKRTLPSCRLTT